MEIIIIIINKQTFFFFIGIFKVVMLFHMVAGIITLDGDYKKIIHCTLKTNQAYQILNSTALLLASHSPSF